MIAFMVLAFVGVALFAALVGAVLLRSILWLVLLPLRLVFALLLLPFRLIGAVFAGLMFLIAVPVVALLGLIAAVVLTAALAVPLAPVLLVLFVFWMLTRPRRQVLLPQHSSELSRLH